MTKIAASGRLSRIGVDRCISHVGSFQWFTRIPAESGISAGNRSVWDAGCLLAVTRTYDAASSDRATRQIFSARSEEHTSELQSLMRISYAVLCLKSTKNTTEHPLTRQPLEQQHQS